MKYLSQDKLNTKPSKWTLSVLSLNDTAEVIMNKMSFHLALSISFEIILLEFFFIFFMFLKLFLASKTSLTVFNYTDTQPLVRYYIGVKDKLCEQLAHTQTHGHAHTTPH